MVTMGIVAGSQHAARPAAVFAARLPRQALGAPCLVDDSVRRLLPQPAPCHPLPLPPMPCCRLDIAAHFFRAVARPACDWRPAPCQPPSGASCAGDAPAIAHCLPALGPLLPAPSPDRPAASPTLPRRRLGPPPSPADGGVRGGAWDAPHRLHGQGDRQRRAQGVRGGAWTPRIAPSAPRRGGIRPPMCTFRSLGRSAPRAPAQARGAARWDGIPQVHPPAGPTGRGGSGQGRLT